MLIECIPNVSEGRRQEVVAALADAIRRVPSVRLLDFSSDTSHNRSVFTLVGDAADGRAAVDAVCRLRPDVALMDIRMPVQDGLAATRAITADPGCPTKVVVLTTLPLSLVLRPALAEH